MEEHPKANSEDVSGLDGPSGSHGPGTAHRPCWSVVQPLVGCDLRQRVLFSVSLSSAEGLRLSEGTDAMKLS